MTVLPLLLPSRLTTGERAFVAFAGLKGAVPLLLGTLLLALPTGERLFGVVVVVVLLSVLGQGTLVPTLARVWRIHMRVVEPEPFALGLRLHEEPTAGYRLVVASGAPVDGRQIKQISELGQGTWISLVRRAGALVPLNGSTVLRAGDQVLVLIDEAQDPAVVFERFEGGESSVAGSDGSP
jgi:cell volume regulation protein A